MVTVNDYKEFAVALAEYSDDQVKLNDRRRALLEFNSANGFNWANPPEGVEVDGSISGSDFSAAEASNVLGSMEEIGKFVKNTYGQNETPNPADHMGNFQKLARPARG